MRRRNTKTSSQSRSSGAGGAGRFWDGDEQTEITRGNKLRKSQRSSPQSARSSEPRKPRTRDRGEGTRTRSRPRSATPHTSTRSRHRNILSSTSSWVNSVGDWFRKQYANRDQVIPNPDVVTEVPVLSGDNDYFSTPHPRDGPAGLPNPSRRSVDSVKTNQSDHDPVETTRSSDRSRRTKSSLWSSIKSCFGVKSNTSSAHATRSRKHSEDRPRAHRHSSRRSSKASRRPLPRDFPENVPQTTNHEERLHPVNPEPVRRGSPRNTDRAPSEVSSENSSASSHTTRSVSPLGSSRSEGSHETDWTRPSNDSKSSVPSRRQRRNQESQRYYSSPGETDSASSSTTHSRRRSDSHNSHTQMNPRKSRSPSPDQTSKLPRRRVRTAKPRQDSLKSHSSGEWSDSDYHVSNYPRRRSSREARQAARNRGNPPPATHPGSSAPIPRHRGQRHESQRSHRPLERVDSGYSGSHSSSVRKSPGGHRSHGKTRKPQVEGETKIGLNAGYYSEKAEEEWLREWERREYERRLWEDESRYREDREKHILNTIKENKRTYRELTKERKRDKRKVWLANHFAAAARRCEAAAYYVNDNRDWRYRYPHDPYRTARHFNYSQSDHPYGHPHGPYGTDRQSQQAADHVDASSADPPNGYYEPKRA